jgi:hypothetical protein
MLGISEGMARGLLLMQRWDKDKLIEKFTDSSDFIEKAF